jgi:hypothetical protein
MERCRHPAGAGRISARQTCANGPPGRSSCAAGMGAAGSVGRWLTGSREVRAELYHGVKMLSNLC